MAYSVVDIPTDYSSAHGDIICTVYDDDYFEVNYRYVADVYIGDSFITRLKSVPDPVSGLGIFNFGMIYRNYVNSNLYGIDVSSADVILTGLYYYKLEMHIEWGYEYGTSSEFFDVGIETSRGISITNHYNSRLLGNQRTLLPYYENNTLSNRPTETSMYNALQYPGVGFNPKLLIGMWYNYDGDYELHVKWTAYNYSNTLTGGLERNAGAINGLQFYQLNISPEVVRYYSASLITSLTKYLKIEIIKYNVNNELSTVLKKYIVNLKCENRYTPITLVWLNKLGTYDSYTFPKVSKKSYNVTKKNYNQLEYYIDGSDGKAKYFNEDIGNDNKPTYNVNFKESRIINSDLIDEKTYRWLNELLVSPLVYMQSDELPDREDIYDTNDPASRYLIPINITDSTFNFKTKAVERQFNLTLKIEFGDTLNAQYR
jgi:hypothetical protein